MKFRFKVAVSSVAVLLASGAVSTVALATPASNPPPTAVPNPPVIGVLDGPAKARNDGIRFEVKADTKIAAFELTYPIGATSGWHSHPGIVIAVVKSGKVTRQVGCQVKTFTAHESFTEVDPHFVSNFYHDASDPKAEAAVLEITQIFPASVADDARRIDQPAPVCPYGLSTD